MWALFQLSFERRSVAFAFVCFITAASRFEKYSSLKSHCSSITPLLIRLGDNRLYTADSTAMQFYVFLNLCLVGTLMLYIQVHSLSYVSLAYIYACCSRF